MSSDPRRLRPVQRIPAVTRADVERIAARDFPSARARVLEILHEYGAQDRQREADRVRLAALKLAAGNLERLRAAIETAKTDYRDVLAAAEYPGYARALRPSQAVSPAERQRIIDADWRQYRAWLAR